MIVYVLRFNSGDDAFIKEELKAKTHGEAELKVQRIADKLIRLEKEKQGVRV